MEVYNDFKQLYSDKVTRDYIFCLIADIHNSKYTSQNLWTKIIKAIKNQNPDAIFIAGDIIYYADDFANPKIKDKLDYLLIGLSKVAPVYISLGNHDLKEGKIKTANDTLSYFEQLTKKHNIFLLNNVCASFDDNIVVAGFSPEFNSYYVKYKANWYDYFIDSLIASEFGFEEEKYGILLTHSPEIISILENYINNIFKELENSESNEEILLLRQKLEKTLTVLNQFALILCGHMHDGFVPKHWQKLGIVKSDKGFVASEGEKFLDSRIRLLEKCRGVHDVFKSKMIITGGITKWCQPNPLFSVINNFSSKDITTIKVMKKL